MFPCLQARLKAHWSVGVIRDDITLEKVGGARMVVFGCPRDKFSVAEVTNMWRKNLFMSTHSICRLW